MHFHYIKVEEGLYVKNSSNPTRRTALCIPWYNKLIAKKLLQGYHLMPTLIGIRVVKMEINGLTH